jgi:hypothetical protein
MNSSTNWTARPGKPALKLISLATMAPELAHKNLRSLLLANPDYFDRITTDSFKAVLRIQQDTTYESIGYVSYSPSLEQLQTTIHINQNSGYSEADCISKEYVRFYLSYDGGLMWHDQGVSLIGVCNLAEPLPQQEIVAVPITTAATLCFLERLPLVRTILSWNTPPPANMPDWIPVWGDVLNSKIQLEEMQERSLHPGLEGFSNPEAGCSAF